MNLGAGRLTRLVALYVSVELSDYILGFPAGVLDSEELLLEASTVAGVKVVVVRVPVASCSLNIPGPA